MFGALLGAGLGLLGSILGGNSAAKASKQAGDLQYRAAQDAIREQQRQFDVIRGDYAPYLESGVEALGLQGNLVGLNGGGVQAEAINALRESPLFRSLYEGGLETVLQNASATGGIRGGNTQRGLADFSADTLTRVIEHQLAQLGGISGRGQAATGSVSEFGQGATNNIIQMINQGAAARAGDVLTRGGIANGIWNNVGSFFQGMVPKLGGLF